MRFFFRNQSNKKSFTQTHTKKKNAQHKFSIRILFTISPILLPLLSSYKFQFFFECLQIYKSSFLFTNFEFEIENFFFWKWKKLWRKRKFRKSKVWIFFSFFLSFCLLIISHFVVFFLHFIYSYIHIHILFI